LRLYLTLKHAKNRITEHLRKSKEEGLVNNSPDYYLARLTITEDYHSLKDCSLVIECTIENIDIKRSVYDKIEVLIATDALLTSNTSAIPISTLQNKRVIRNVSLGYIGQNLPTLPVFLKLYAAIKAM
jgi:3-hydroxybutyryl-CoA dehydrogenase